MKCNLDERENPSNHCSRIKTSRLKRCIEDSYSRRGYRTPSFSWLGLLSLLGSSLFVAPPFFFLLLFPSRLASVPFINMCRSMGVRGILLAVFG